MQSSFEFQTGPKLNLMDNSIVVVRRLRGRLEGCEACRVELHSRPVFPSGFTAMAEVASLLHASWLIYCPFPLARRTADKIFEKRAGQEPSCDPCSATPAALSQGKSVFRFSRWGLQRQLHKASCSKPAAQSAAKRATSLSDLIRIHKTEHTFAQKPAHQ